MKTLRNLSFLVVFLLIFQACKQEKTPEQITVLFANHFSAGEYVEARQYSTESTIQLLEMMESLESVGFTYGDELPPVITHKDVTCSETGDVATCTYLEFGELIQLDLIKVDGNWLINFDLEKLDDTESWYEDEDEDDLEFDGNEINTTNDSVISNN